MASADEIRTALEFLAAASDAQIDDAKRDAPDLATAAQAGAEILAGADGENTEFWSAIQGGYRPAGNDGEDNRNG